MYENKTRISSWKAKTGILDITVVAEPWGKYHSYNRRLISDPNSYVQRWQWTEGTSDPDKYSSIRTNEDVSEILDALVVDHEELGLLYTLYGIEG